MKICKQMQMFDIHKMSSLLPRINLPQIFTFYDVQRLQNLSEGFQENIIGGLILVCNRYSEQSVCNLTKRRTLPPVFSGEIFENGWLWTVASAQSKIAACNVILFLTIKVSAFFYNVTLNIEFLKIATSKPIVSTEQAWP